MMNSLDFIGYDGPPGGKGCKEIMVTAHADVGWKLDVDRGPDWVFVRLLPADAEDSTTGDFALAERVWALLEQSFTYRLVLELDDVPVIQSYLIAQLVLLSKRIHSHGGMLRLCGLSPQNEQVIQLCRLAGCLPTYHSRSHAIMGSRPTQPR